MDFTFSAKKKVGIAESRVVWQNGSRKTVLVRNAQKTFRITEKGGVEFKGGSRHDRNRHDSQNRHGCLIVLYFVGQAQGGQGALQNRQKSPRLPPLNSTPLLRDPEIQVGMNGDTFSIKAPKNVLRSLLPLFKDNS